VSLAEKRLNAAIASKPKKSELETERGSGGQPEAAAQTGDPAPQTPERKGDSGPQPEGAQATAGNPDKKSPDAGEPAEVKPKDAKSISSAERNQENEPDSSSARPPEKGAGEVGQPPNSSQQGSKRAEPSLPQSETAPTAPAPSPAPQAGDAEQPQAENKREPEGDPEGNKESTGPLSNMISDQAARAVPRLSEELLKKAEQLKAGEVKPEDIQRLAKAAEMLARDLAPIAQSKEFQQSLQQLARQVDPEQLEQVARQLMSQEKLRQELEAAARLLMQNRQAREIAAGLARQFDQMQPPRPAPDGGQTARQRNGQGDGQPSGGQGSSRGQAERREAENRTSGLGKEQKLGGKLQKKDGGEYLFLQSRPDAGASRVPYSSAYPRYRREAERSVERSRIPPNMRKVVRGYFDAINPDSGKKQ
jgi:hypothetical protein